MLEIKNVYKTYSSKNGVTHRALENVSLKFADKGLVFILGKSGSGKSTLLNLIGGLDDYDRGDICFNNQSFRNFKEEDFNHYRNSQIGFVFQDFNLINTLSVYDNVALSLDLQNKTNNSSIDEILKQMNVYSLKNRKPNELSGGQKQRVAIARALIKNPKIILADEPTGSLDSENSIAIINIIKELSKDRLVIVVTHNKDLAYDYGDRIIEIRDGFVLKDLMRKDQFNVSGETSTLASSNLVIIPKGKQISEDNLNDLNVTISEKRQDHYILIESNKNRVISLYPNVKEVISDENNEELFKPYIHTYVNKEYIKPKKSHLPLKKGIKIGMSNIKKKLGSMIFTILLSIMSVLFIGSASNFTQYSLPNAVGMSIEKDNGKYLEVSSSFAVSDSTYKLQDADINYLESLDNEVSYAYEANLMYSYPGRANSSFRNDYLFKNLLFKGFLVCDSIENLGYKQDNFKVIYQLENITSEDYKTGFYMSSVVANTIIKHDETCNNLYESVSDLLGVKMSIGDNYYKVLGIYDVNERESLYKEFETLSESDDAEGEHSILANQYRNIADSILLKLAVKPEFIENYAKTMSSFTFKPFTNNNLDREVKGKSIYNLANCEIENMTIEFYDSSWNESNFKSKIKTMKPNQVFVGGNYYKKITNKAYTYPDNPGNMPDDILKYNKSKEAITVIDGASKTSNDSMTYYYLENVEVIGVVYRNSADSSTDSVYFSPEVFNEISSKHVRPNTALISMNSFDNYSKMVATLYDNGFTINNEFIGMFTMFASIFDTYSVIVNVVAILLFIVVGLLLYSFMSNSIKKSSKQIGILKALGASMKDLYKIYSMEAVIIGLFSTVIGVGYFYIVGLIINKVVSLVFFDFYFAIFTFEPITIITMVLSTIIVILVSLVIPLSKLKNIKPIEVMNSND